MPNDVTKTALDRYEKAKSYWSDIIERGEGDVDFLYGDQWDPKFRQSRESDGRPCLQENRLLSFVHLICNQIRQANPSINTKPVDDAADTKTSEVLDGIIRNIQHVSDSETVYDTASRNAITAGLGWIRVVTDYADYDSFDQEIKIERVLNPFSCLLEPEAERLDGGDAEYGFVLGKILVGDARKEHPEANISSEKDEEEIEILEYFYKEYEAKTLYLTREYGAIYEDDPRYSESLAITDERKVDVCRIKYAKILQEQIVEETVFPGKYIPLIPVVGDEAYVSGKRQLYSMIHNAKDPQRYFNYMKSSGAEVISLQPKSPFIAPKGSFNSNAKKWATANVNSYAFLEYDVQYDRNGNVLPAPQRQPVPQGSAAMFQEMMAAADGMKAVMGIYNPSLGNQSNDVSGKAIIARQLQGDNSNFHFVDNLAVALRQVGRVIIGMVPYVYSAPRIVRILGEDKRDSLVPVNQAVIQEGSSYRVPNRNEKANAIIDLKAGKYDIVVEIGAAYSTRRQEAANAIIEIARVKPEILEVAGDILIDSLDIPNGQQLVKRIRSIMPPELLGDDIEAERLRILTEQLGQLQQRLGETEAALLAKQNNQQFENQIATKKIEIDKQKVEIEALKAMADIEKTKAETQNINAETMTEISNRFSALEGRFEDVSGAIDIMLSAAESNSKATGEPQSPEPIEEQQ